MPFLSALRHLLPILAVLAVAGCAAPGVPPPDRRDVMDLAASLRALGPEVDPVEAARAADIAYNHARQLATDYGVTDPPLIHNTKVNLGLRPRGLCYQWADDIEARLRQENFQTFEFHRAIANTDSILIDHSTVILSRRGGAMSDGIVIDGWRDSGRLFWSPVREDRRYRWVPRADVFAERRAQESR